MTYLRMANHGDGDYDRKIYLKCIMKLWHQNQTSLVYDFIFNTFNNIIELSKDVTNEKKNQFFCCFFLNIFIVYLQISLIFQI